MKVLHLPYTFFPDPVGGTEVYVEALAQEQRAERISAMYRQVVPQAVRSGLAQRGW